MTTDAGAARSTSARRPTTVAMAHAWRVDAPPEAVWAVLADTDAHRRRWPWLRCAPLPPLEVGARARIAIHPPLPYALHLDLVATEVVPETRVAVQVDGDLRGVATLALAPLDHGTLLELGWHLTVARPALQRLAGMARPVLVWGHDWVVRQGLARLADDGIVLVPVGDTNGEGRCGGRGPIRRGTIVAVLALAALVVAGRCRRRRRAGPTPVRPTTC